MRPKISMTPHDIKMLKGVLSTMKCVSNNRTNMPGMKLEDIIPWHSIQDVENECMWVENFLRRIS